MGTEKRTGTETEKDSEIEWLGEIERTVHVKRGRRVLKMVIGVKIGYTEKNDMRREIMYMVANVYDAISGKYIGMISERKAEDGTLSVVHVEALMDFYNTIINKVLDGDFTQKSARIDGWL
jgi:KaiC/GvpD/RAD55 family RecA-like ATPase